jgi:thiamine phosphate synthase YjbQ (UPF0047 family)
MENADPAARRDLEKFSDRLVPENAPYFEHNDEGPDDMPSHIRMMRLQLVCWMKTANVPATIPLRVRTSER